MALLTTGTDFVLQFLGEKPGVLVLGVEDGDVEGQDMWQLGSEVIPRRQSMEHLGVPFIT